MSILMPDPTPVTPHPGTWLNAWRTPSCVSYYLVPLQIIFLQIPKKRVLLPKVGPFYVTGQASWLPGVFWAYGLVEICKNGRAIECALGGNQYIKTKDWSE